VFAAQKMSRLCVDLSVNVLQPRLAWHVLLLSGVLQRKAMCDSCVNSHVLVEAQTVRIAPKTYTHDTCLCYKDINAMMVVQMAAC